MNTKETERIKNRSNLKILISMESIPEIPQATDFSITVGTTDQKFSLSISP